MCLQLERLSASMRTKPTWKLIKENLSLEYLSNSIYWVDIYLYRTDLKPLKFILILDVYSWCTLSPQS